MQCSASALHLMCCLHCICSTWEAFARSSTGAASLHGVALYLDMLAVCTHRAGYAVVPMHADVVCGWINLLNVHELCRYQPGMRPPAPRRTFRTHWNDMCRSTFAQAFCMFTGGAHTVCLAC